MRAGKGEEGRNAKGGGKAKIGRTRGRGQEFEREREGKIRADHGERAGI